MLAKMYSVYKCKPIQLLMLLFLICSITINILLLRRTFLPIISGNVGPNSCALWRSSDDLEFSGVAVSITDKRSNSKDGYQVFSGAIRKKSRIGPGFECEIANTVVIEEYVSIDFPFQSQDRPCKILEFDGQSQIARIFAQGIEFSIHGKSATWQDKKGSGPLVPVLDYVFNGHQYQ